MTELAVPTFEDVESELPDTTFKDLPTKARDAGAQAREQAEEYGGVFAPTVLTLDGGQTVTIPPHPSLRLLDDDVLAALDQLEFDLEQCDRYPDIHFPVEKSTDSDGNEITIPAHTQPGALKLPYRKTDANGKTTLLEPFDVQQARIVIGADYQRLRSGTINGKRGSVADVKAVWREQMKAIEERQKRDSKSAGGAVDSPAVPPSDPA